MKLLSTLEDTLRREPNYVADDGHLKKWVIINKAQNYDETLLSLLLGQPELKGHFFRSIAGALVFDQPLFVEFMEQKNYLNDSFTAYKNKIGLTIDGKFLNQRNEVVLVWPYKDCVLEGGQSREEQSRDEIFFNQTLAQDEITQLLEPKVLTNARRYSAEEPEGEPIADFTRDEAGHITDNLIVKGNNLLGLHSLKQQFAGRVKLIYIDPPYNTGEDEFKYNDSFNHSTWLTFIRNRLEAAKSLLREDGIIFVQINDVEQAYLKILLDEVFGSDCYEANICVKMSHLSGPKMAHKERKIPKIKESILMYSKKPNSVRLNPQYTVVTWEEAFDRYSNFIDCYESPENYTDWKSISLNQALKVYEIDPSDEISTLNFKLENAHRIFQTAINRSKNYPRQPANAFLKIDDKYVLNGRELIFASEKIREIGGKKQPVSIISDIWTDIGINNVFQEGGKEISLRFGKKPEMLIERILLLASNEEDIVLDFFVGTGTTCAVAHKMNRQYIGIEQLNYTEELPKARMKTVINGDLTGISRTYQWAGGGSFVYLELKKYNELFMEQIEAAADIDALLSIWEQMKQRSFLAYNIDLKQQDKRINEFKALSLQQQKEILAGLLDKNQLYVNHSAMDDADFGVTDEDKQLTIAFYRN